MTSVEKQRKLSAAMVTTDSHRLGVHAASDQKLIVKPENAKRRQTTNTLTTLESVFPETALIPAASGSDSQREDNVGAPMALAARQVPSPRSFQSSQMPSGASTSSVQKNRSDFARALPNNSLTNTANQPPSVAKKAPTELALSPRSSSNALSGAWHKRFTVQIDAAMDETSADQMVGRLQHLGYQPHLITVW
jgi:cell division septation protein DedD